MFREAINDLKRWKSSANRKPLILHGARQVGKTWLLRDEFGAKEFKNVAYIMMAENPRMKTLFEAETNADTLIRGLEVEAGLSFNPTDTLIILDEVQEVPKAVAALKYIYEQRPEYHLAVAGSLLGVTLLGNISFPVGKVNSLYLYPMNFYEFVRAVKSEKFAEMLASDDQQLLPAFHDELNSLLKQYLVIGGMPEVVQNFAKSGDYLSARVIQKQIVSDYEHDFGKHAPTSIIPRIQMVFNSLPSQLAKENKKFVYGTLKSGARAKDYELAIQWLESAGIIARVSRIKKPASPLKHYEDLSAFKLFMVDVGLLSAMSGLEPRTVLESSSVFTEYKGALTEQFVQQQLLSTGQKAYYYSSDDAKTEIDFVVERGGTIIPIEVKSAEHLASKSLNNFVEKYDLKQAIKYSLLPRKDNAIIHNIPLYLSFLIVGEKS